MDLKDVLMLGWNWSISDRLYCLFIVYIVKSLVVYVIVVFVFYICIY